MGEGEGEGCLVGDGDALGDVAAAAVGVGVLTPATETGVSSCEEKRRKMPVASNAPMRMVAVWRGGSTADENQIPAGRSHQHGDR